MAGTLSRDTGTMPGRATMMLVVLPACVRWGITLGCGAWLASMAAVDAEGHTSPGRWLLALVPVALSALAGMLAAMLLRANMFYALLGWLTSRGELGRAMSSAGVAFCTKADEGNHGLVTRRAVMAAREAGLAEADSILKELARGGEPSPTLWWRVASWAERFGDAANRVFPYDRVSSNRLPRGWWADMVLPGHEGPSSHMELRRTVIMALPHADPDEGARLAAFLAECAAMARTTMKAEEKAEFAALSARAVSMAESIVAGSSGLPFDGERGSLGRMRRILSDDAGRVQER